MKQQSKWTVTLLTLLVLGGVSICWAGDGRPTVGFYEKQLVDPAGFTLTSRVEAVFQRVRNVADKRSNRLPELRIVNKIDDPLAFALPSGHIVLSKRAVEWCYQGVAPELGDTRLAFILGHELAHLSKDDFSHQETWLALSGNPEGEKIRALLKSTTDVPGADMVHQKAVTRLKEAEADDLGFVYAAAAGYPANVLVGDPAQGQEDFFTYWEGQAQSRAASDPSHPDASMRAEILRSRLGRIAEKLSLYDAGTRLALLGRCREANQFLREFQSVFPSREVFNNLGECHLQLARQQMDEAMVARFWLSSRLDPESNAPKDKTKSGTDVVSKEARRELEQAVVYLQKAATVDGTYLPARINLAAALFYLGEIFPARASAEEAWRLAPNDLEVQGLRHFLFYQDGASNGLGPASLTPLRQLAASPQAPLSAMYNLARLLEEQKEETAAREIWKRLGAHLADIPLLQRRAICIRLASSDPLCGKTVARSVPPPWVLPVVPGLDLEGKEAGTAKTLLAGWQATPFSFYKGKDKKDGHLYRREDHALVMEWDRYVELVLLRDGTLGDVTQLHKKVGEPVEKRQTANGEVWVYPPSWAARVMDGQVREIWVYSPIDQ